jgi:hypothetical protein
MVMNARWSFLVLLVCVGCEKAEVDPGQNSNFFDPEHAGQLMFIDSVRTVPLVGGTIHEQRIHGHVDERLWQIQPVKLVMYESVRDRYDTVLATVLNDGQFMLRNFQVTLGTEYCFVVDMLFQNVTYTGQRWQACEIAN